MRSHAARCAGSVLLVLAAGAAQGADADALERCRAITDPQQRLACYDAAMEEQPALRPAPLPASPPGPPPVAVLLGETTLGAERSLIGDRWSIGVPERDSRFDLRPHRQSYFLLGRWSDAPNTLPTSPSKPPLDAPLDIQNVEAKFQISFKVKLADFFDEIGGSVWAAYTQQSQWQVYNSATSRPFRETNYEPEVMLAFHPDSSHWGWRWRLMAIGINHQSNGRSEPLSRSWNRVVAQFGVERDNVALLLRPWWRLPESASSDDNPDITRYIGNGELVAVWAPGQNTYSLMLRGSLSSGNGAAQLSWNFPLARRVRGTLQLFSGYGESLIDYNVKQKTIGFGISLADHL